MRMPALTIEQPTLARCLAQSIALTKRAKALRDYIESLPVEQRKRARDLAVNYLRRGER